MFSRLAYNPIILRKGRRNLIRSINYSPSISRELSPYRAIKYAPIRLSEAYGIFRPVYDYSPFTFRSLSSDYAPQNYNVQGFFQKYAPITEHDLYTRYAPYSNRSLIYEPIIASKFKPQPIVISNAQALKDYYDYLIELLTILE